jgi:hypothetical protein
MESSPSLDGFDPLAADSEQDGDALTEVLEQASKRLVHNILKSYTGYFDIFSEVLQNALDAVQQQSRISDASYAPQIWVSVDIPAGKIRVVDNGIGMSEQQFRYCLRPNVSFKKQTDLRGHKGVGATFLAYGFSFMRLQSKQNGLKLAAILRQGRQWAEDTSGTVPRPKFEVTEFDAPELSGNTNGTAVEILVGQASGERPKNLGWIGATTAQQWYDVLRVKTPLGGVYLSGSPVKVKIHLVVVSPDKNETKLEIDRAEYYYPHEIPNLKTQSISDITTALNKISGDTLVKFNKLGAEFKRLDCLWDVWDKSSLLAENSYFASALNDEDRLLIEKHSVIVYGAFLRSAKIWTELNDEILLLRKNQRIIHGGLQLASDFMTQGDLSIIPLTSAIGYQANAHVIVHFTDGNPDMGRKVFQPELKDLADRLSVRAVTTFKKFMQHLKPDTGAQTLTPDKELHDWKKAQEEYRNRAPMSFSKAGLTLALVSKPQQEQDVIALFHELIGADVLKGFKIFATSQSDRYDSLIFMDYEKDQDVLFDSVSQRLGVTRDYSLPYSTEPKVMEYKYSFDSLVSDFDKEEKFAKQIDFVVCWKAGTHFREKFFFQPLLIGEEGSSRQIFGATHQAFTQGAHNQPAFEVLILEDLLNWLQDPTEEEARQKRAYRD